MSNRRHPLDPDAPVGRHTLTGDAEARDRATQDANPGFTVPQDSAGHPAPQTAADVAVDPARNPHNVQTIPGSAPEHYRDGKLTRDGMVAALRRGGSVLHNGQVITQERHLPSEADLAKGDTELTRRALAGLDQQQRELDAQKQKLLAASVAPAAAAPTETAAAPAAPKSRKRGGKKTTEVKTDSADTVVIPPPADQPPAGEQK